VIEALAALEATAVAQHLKAARWTYPLVNAGHVLGVALLVGAVLPMDVAVLRGRGAAVVAWLRPWAMAGMVLAVGTGGLLFATQAGDYLQSPWFAAKIAVLALAVVNAALFLVRGRGRTAVLLSLVLWPGVLVLGRMIAYG
jgi:uncharacterized membrane protein SirB2